MTIPQIIPAITARTAAGKRTDDAFIATSALRPSHLRPNFTARSCVINSLLTVSMGVQYCAMNRRRPYTLKRRAENQAETRRRIVEATVDLHTEVGPSRTSISAIAVRAGVQRHTVYAHFPTARELFLACSGLTLERDPLPD